MTSSWFVNFLWVVYHQILLDGLINSLRLGDTYMRHWIEPSLVQLKWLAARSAPSHCLNQWWLNVNCTLNNKVQWNLNQNSNILCTITAILSRPQCVNEVYTAVFFRVAWIALGPSWNLESVEIHTHVIDTWPNWGSVNAGSGIGFVPSDTIVEYIL